MNEEKKREEDKTKELTLEDLGFVIGGLPDDGGADDEEIEYPQRKGRYPKGPGELSG